MTVLAWLLVISSSLWIGFGLVAVLRVRSAARRHPSAARPPSLPAVSILKPLCGADAALADSLTSFFEQDHPDFELVFGVESPADPAIAVVRALQRRYPEIPCRLVVHDGGKAVNPKVRNLLGMLPHARHELLLISDSNVRAPRHYASEMVATFQTDPTVGLVTSLFAGTDENTLGSALETVQLNGFCAAGATLPTTFGSAAVVGKSMLLSRHTFADLGGLERVADVLAEDYVMGKMFQHGGHRIRIAPTVLANVTADMTLGAFLRRHLRWGMLRVRLLPAAFLLEPLASPVVLLPLAWLALGPWALAWALAMLWLRDVGGWLALRGPRRWWLPALLAPARDLCLLAVWLRALFKRHVTWRDHRVRVGAGTLLYGSVR